VTVVVERTSRLGAPVEAVWEHATSMAGVNLELAPVTMSYPPARATLSDDVPLGTVLFTSTLAVRGVPFDRHQLRLVELEPGRSFQEDSSSRLHRAWRHRRTLSPIDGGCELHDHVEVEPRLPGVGAPTRLLVGRVFDRRHHVLTTMFGRR
jgi:ligand-binding SRPBCC domain-containing protein